MKKHIYQSGSELFFENGVKIGDVLRDVDGYYKFFPELRGGYWDTYVMREIADHIDNLNVEWDTEMQEHFNDPSTS